MKILTGLLFFLIIHFSETDNPFIRDLQAQTQAQHKNLAVYFSGSDWCSNCFQFKKSILENEAVHALLDTGFIFYNADFPQRKKLAKDIAASNNWLAERLNPAGEFPLLVIAGNNMQPLLKVYKGHEVTLVLEQMKKYQKKSSDE